MSAAPRTRTTERTSRSALSGRWTVVPDASQAGFHVRDKLVTTVHGSLPIEDGVVVVSDDGDVTQAWISLSVAGVATGNAHRDRDLRKPRLLDAPRFPTVRVTVDTTKATPDGCSARALMLARGIRVSVDLTAVLVLESASTSDTRVRIRVTGRLDRRPLAIKVPTFVIGRFVDLDADLTLRKVTQEDKTSHDAGARR